MKDFKDLGFQEDDHSDLGFQADDHAQSSPASEAPGYLESFGRGAAQGASMGFADEATAGIESLLTNKKYEDALAESRANYKAAEETNPKMSLAGNLTGGVAGGAALSAAAAPLAGVAGISKAAQAISTLDKLKKAAALGAGMGAITSAGTSEEPLMTRPVELAKDVATGAALGGVGGAVFSKAGDLAGKAASKAREIGAIDDMFRAFNVGERGYNYFKPGDMEKLEGEATEAAAKTRDTVQQKLANFANAKKQILNTAEQQGKTIDILPMFNKAKVEIENLTLDEIGAADKRKLQSVLNGLPQQLDYQNISPSQADRIKQMFSNYTSFGDESLKTKEAKKIAMDMVKALDAQVLNSVDDVTTTAAISGMQQELGNEVTDYLARAQAPGQSSMKTVNKGLSDLMTTQEILGQDSGNAADRIKQIQKLRTMLGRTASEGDGGITARETIKETKKVLQNIAPEIAEQTIGKAEDLADDLYLKKLAKGQIQSGVGSLWGIGNIASVGGSNIAGSVYGASKGLATPDSTGFRMMAKYASKGGDNALSSALDKIANTVDDSRRKAMVNTLMQTPYYRKKIEEIQNKLEGMMGDDDGSKN
jgi:hypothetical protein